MQALYSARPCKRYTVQDDASAICYTVQDFLWTLQIISISHISLIFIQYSINGVHQPSPLQDKKSKQFLPSKKRDCSHEKRWNNANGLRHRRVHILDAVNSASVPLDLKLMQGQRELDRKAMDLNCPIFYHLCYELLRISQRLCSKDKTITRKPFTNKTSKGHHAAFKGHLIELCR